MPRLPHLNGKRLIAAARLARDEKRIERAIKKALSTHRAHALASIQHMAVTASGPPDAFNLVTWDTSVETNVLPVITDVMTDLAFSTTQLLRSSPEFRSQILGQIDVTSRAGTFADKVRNIGPDLASRVTEELTLGASKGESSTALADRLQFVFDDIGENQAARIARTETHGASEAMSNDSASAIAAAGVEVTKSWVSTKDESTREAHVQAEEDNQDIPIDQPFMVDDEELDYPGDPGGSAGNVINCRCSTTYSMPEDDQGPVDNSDMPPEEDSGIEDGG